MSAYCAEIRNISREMKRLRARVRVLATLKEAPSKALYNYMEKHGISSYEGFKKTDLLRKRKPVKGKTQKKRDALKFFYEAGVPNPEIFYTQFLGTQKIDRSPPSV